MFGITVAALQSLSSREKERYQAFYCGLCSTLKAEYGQATRMALSYELTFLVILLGSLYEPRECARAASCPAHPFKPVSHITTRYSEYAADLTIALTYHKCLDDRADGNGFLGLIGARYLSKAYRKAAEKIPKQVQVIEETIEGIREMEQTAVPPDATAIAFGEMLGYLFENIPGVAADVFTGTLGNFGRFLGQFILLADAAIDMDDDAASGAYNPFSYLSAKPAPDDLRSMLAVPIANAAAEYEKLPLIKDAHVLDSIIYQGVWQKFNAKYESCDACVEVKP